jgi:dihydrofolate synthase/folylpolyglutamate synthase
MLNPRKIEIPSAKTYKLEGMLRVSEALGFPQLGRRTVLVAGTNGKGSTCAYLTALFKASGLKVGTYSSPHVVDRTERIRINGSPIRESLLKRYEKRFETDLKSLTYFEKMTVLAFLIFRDLEVDVQVLEVGMGGRLDATNVSDPDISAITRIDYDHQEILGKTLTLIASEKSGVMRPGRVCVTAAQWTEARQQIRLEAKTRGVLLRVSRLGDFTAAESKILKQVEQDWGEHQLQNAMIALNVFKQARKDWKCGRSLSPAKLAHCLSNKVLWPARLQILRRKPLLLVDGAHNINSIEAFVAYWKRHHRHLKDVQCIFGVMEDKDIADMLKRIAPIVSSFHLPSFYPERELKPLDLASKIMAIKPSATVSVYASTQQCVKALLKRSQKLKSPVISLGSLYLAGSVLSELKGKRL